MSTNIQIYEKPVLTQYILMDGVEFELSALISCLWDILDTDEHDRTGKYSLAYNDISDIQTMNKLVSLGLVEKYEDYSGMWMEQYYCIHDKNNVRELLKELHAMNK